MEPLETLKQKIEQNQRGTSIDGIARPKKVDEHLDKLASATFSTPAGKQFLNYLRSITLNAPLGPHASTNELWHKEGMRYLFGIIHTRKEKGDQL